MPAIASIEAALVETPLRHVFATSQDKLARQVSRRVAISLKLDDGTEAPSEATPVAYVTGETPESVLEAVAAAAAALIGGDVLRLRPLAARLHEALPTAPTARAGIEMALYNAHAAALGAPLWKLLGGATTRVETDITLSIVPDAPDRAREAAERGFCCFKMKLGSPDPEEDFARILAVQEAVPGARFRLDANQAFTPDAAIAFIRRTADAGVHLELVEQPVAKEDLAGLDRVAAASPVPVFADEAVKSPADAVRLVRETRVHGINVKLMKAGVAGALDIVAIAWAAGLRLMIGCMLESRLGIACSLAVACGTGAFDFVDLDSHVLLAEEDENTYFTEQGPVLSVLGSE